MVVCVSCWSWGGMMIVPCTVVIPCTVVWGGMTYWSGTVQQCIVANWEAFFEHDTKRKERRDNLFS